MMEREAIEREAMEQKAKEENDELRKAQSDLQTQISNHSDELLSKIDASTATMLSYICLFSVFTFSFCRKAQGAGVACSLLVFR